MKLEIKREYELDTLASALRLSRADALDAIIAHVFHGVVGQQTEKNDEIAAN